MPGLEGLHRETAGRMLHPAGHAGPSESRLPTNGPMGDFVLIGTIGILSPVRSTGAIDTSGRIVRVGSTSRPDRTIRTKLLPRSPNAPSSGAKPMRPSARIRRYLACLA